jgi:anti-anti-sigma factor
MLFLTPLLYHLPQAVLAVIVMFAVFGLVRVAPLVHAWQVARRDAIAGIATFIVTLALAPSLAAGIGVGVALTIALFLVRTMRPRAEVLGRHPDGTLGGITAHGLKPLSENFVAVRFDGSLNFVNVSYFEDIVLEALARYPKTRAVLVIGSGINDIDASGEEKMRELALRLRENGVTLVLSSMKKQVQDVCARSGLCAIIGDENTFKTKERAIDALHERYDRAPATAAAGAPAA